jgi:serine/threonine protein kinase
MKVLLPDVDSTLDLAELFLREIKLVATLDHPNIAELRTAQTSRKNPLPQKIAKPSSAPCLSRITSQAPDEKREPSVEIEY